MMWQYWLDIQSAFRLILSYIWSDSGLWQTGFLHSYIKVYACRAYVYIDCTMYHTLLTSDLCAVNFLPWTLGTTCGDDEF